jgi:hypothetical protein
MKNLVLQDRNDPEAYLEWEKKIKFITEFIDYAII